MNIVTPAPAELVEVRADPVLFEQELDGRPATAEALERALGFRAGRAYWLAEASGTLYSIELGDFGRGRPSMALVYAHWPRFEPRPLSDDEINRDLAELCLWLAGISPDLDVEIMEQVLGLAWAASAAGDAFRLP
jgi:hypothetical protein